MVVNGYVPDTLGLPRSKPIHPLNPPLLYASLR